MKLRDLYYEFIALEENPILSELLDETREAMDEARDSLMSEPTDAAWKAKLEAVTEKYEKLKKALAEETTRIVILSQRKRSWRN